MKVGQRGQALLSLKRHAPDPASADSADARSTRSHRKPFAAQSPGQWPPRSGGFMPCEQSTAARMLSKPHRKLTPQANPIQSPPIVQTVDLARSTIRAFSGADGRRDRLYTRGDCTPPWRIPGSARDAHEMEWKIHSSKVEGSRKGRTAGPVARHDGDATTVCP